MKKQILMVAAGAAMVCLAYGVQAQGTIYLNNYDSNMGVYENGSNAPLSGFVEILAGSSAGTLAPVESAGLLSDNIPLTDNAEGATAGTFFDGGYGVVNGVGGGGTAFLQVIAWDGGSSFATSTYSGVSAVWSQVIGTVVPPPPNTPTPASIAIPGPINMILSVPEPATFALAGLGIASLLAFRRRK
jgi:PEP-CTERM motif